jgi:hypothetical protein
MDRTYTDHPAGHLSCGRCRQPIRSRGQGEGFDHVAVGADGYVVAVEAGHVAWWNTDRDLRHAIRLDDPLH